MDSVTAVQLQKAKGNDPREGDQGKLAYLKWRERAEKGTRRYKGKVCSRIVSPPHRCASFLFTQAIEHETDSLAAWNLVALYDPVPGVHLR